MGVVWGVAFTMWVLFGVWLPVPDLGSEKLAMYSTSELNDNATKHLVTAAATYIQRKEKEPAS